MANSNNSFQRGFLLNGDKGKKKSQSGAREEMNERKNSSGFRSGFLLGSETKKTKSVKGGGGKKMKKVSSQATGYAKGFLLSDSKRDITDVPRKRTSSDVTSHTTGNRHQTSVSQELIDFEGTPRPKPLLILEETKKGVDSFGEKGNSRKPLITVLNDGLLGTSSSASSDHTATKNFDQSKIIQFVEKDEEPLFQEVTTRRNQQGNVIESFTGPVEVTTCSGITSVEDPSQETTNHALGSGAKNEPSCLEFQQELENIFWMEKKVLPADSIPGREWTTQQVTWAWECLLRKSAQNKLPRHHQSLLWSLLRYHPGSVLAYLKPESQYERTKSLKVVCFLKAFLQDAEDTAREIKWPINVFDALQLLSHQKRRTVLAQESWNTAILVLVALTKAIIDESDEKDLKSNEVPAMMKSFENLIQTQLLWKQSKKESIKRQSEIAILNDWKRLNDILYNHGDSLTWCCELCNKNGGLQQTLSVTSPPHSTNFTLLNDALISYIQNSSQLGNNTLKEFEKRGLLRQILLLVETLNTDQHQELIETGLNLLPHCAWSDTVDLIISLLNILWCNTKAIPSDTTTSSSKNTDLVVSPQSFDCLLQGLDSLSNQVSTFTTITPTCQALGSLVARYIAAESDSSLELMKTLVKRHGMRTSTIFVMLVFLSNNSSFDKFLPSTSTKNNDDNVLLYALELLVTNIPHSQYLRHYLLDNDDPLTKSNIPLEFTIPRLFQILIEPHSGMTTTNADEVKSSVGKVLTSMLGIYVQQNKTGKFIIQIVAAMKEIAATASVGKIDTVAGDICSVIGGRWRRSLLQNEDLPVDSFKKLLIAMAEAMFSSPESLTPLCLFGAVVGEDVGDELKLGRDQETKIALAIEELVTHCCSQLAKNCQTDGPNMIFSRLSPLLILRRLPAVYFSIVRQESHSKRMAESLNPFDSLAKEIAMRLISIGTEQGTDTTRLDEYLPQERRLAAEVAGRCLSFGRSNHSRHGFEESRSYSLYQQICDPVFGTFFEDIAKKDTQLVYIKQAKGALYAVWNHINCVENEIYYFEDAYLQTASFALSVLCLDLEKVGRDSVSEMEQLQTGCIEFFAICVEKVLSMQPDGSSSKRLVEEEGTSRSEESAPLKIKQMGYSASTALPVICRALVAVIRYGKSEESWVGKSTKVYSVPTRICIWNVFLLVSKRCQEDNNALARFSKSMLPWVTDWGETEPDDGVHHPICVAAALQVVFILVTRSRTLCGFSDSDSVSKDYIRRTHRWALNILKFGSTKVSNGLKDMRLAALKLLLAIVTLDNMDSDTSVLCNSLGPGELGETFTVINGLCNMDTDSEVRVLAAQINDYLKKA